MNKQEFEKYWIVGSIIGLTLAKVIFDKMFGTEKERKQKDDELVKNSLKGLFPEYYKD